jgi:hypothetical protein
MQDLLLLLFQSRPEYYKICAYNTYQGVESAGLEVVRPRPPLLAGYVHQRRNLLNAVAVFDDLPCTDRMLLGYGALVFNKKEAEKLYLYFLDI